MRLNDGLKHWRERKNTSEIVHRQKTEAIYREQLRMDAKAERLSRYNIKEIICPEESIQKEKSKEEMGLRSDRLAQQEQLAAELANIKREEFVQLKLRQQLRESNADLRELENKLRIAYVNKDLAAQIKERELKAIYDKMREEKTLEAMKEMEQKHILDEAKREQEEYIRKLEYRHELQEQIQREAEKKKALYKKFLEEKKLLDEVVRAIHEEDMKEEEMKMLQKKNTKEEMDMFYNYQKMLKKQQERALLDEDKRIKEFLEKKEVVMKEYYDRVKQCKDMIDKRQQIVIDNLRETLSKKEAENEVLENLIIAERLIEEERKAQQDMENEFREKLLLTRAREEQNKQRLEQLKRDADLDEHYRQQMLAKFAEDERLEQMTKERRRQTMLNHRKAIDEMILDRQRQRIEEMQALKALHELEEKEINLRHKIVEEERIRILQEHAKNLIGYLPKGVLRPAELCQIDTGLTFNQQEG